MGKQFVSISAGVLAGLMSGAASAQNLLDADPGPLGPGGVPTNPNFNNPSFEQPDIPQFIPFAYSWEASGPAIPTGGPGSPLIVAGCGIFENPPTTGHLNGMTGTQAAWLFANSYVGFGPQSDPVDHAWTQVTQLAFEAGKQYRLAVDVANAQSAPPLDSSLTISLFAQLDATTELPLASYVLKNDGTTDLNDDEFTTFHTDTAPIAGAAIGKPIGIRFLSASPVRNQPSFDGGQWDLDNVQLTIVPEPTSLALFAGAAGLLATRTRRRTR
jgi:hypothetical protein